MENIEKTLSESKENNTKEVIDVLKSVVDKVNEDENLYGQFSVKIGKAHVYIKENEKSEIYDTNQYGDLYLYFGKREYFGVSDSLCHYISFFDDFGRLKHGKSISEDDINQILVFEDAYEKICETIDKIVAYNNRYYENGAALCENISKSVMEE